MADRHDMTIGIGLKADLEGGVQTEKQLEKVRQKAAEMGKASSEAGNKAGASFSRLQQQVGKLRAALTGFGFAGMFTGLVAGIQKIAESFGHARKAAEEFAKEQAAAAQARSIEELVSGYERLKEAIAAGAAEQNRQLGLIDAEVSARRRLDAARLASEKERALAGLDPSSPDYAEKVKAVEARFGAAEASMRASNAEEDVTLVRQRLESQAAAKDGEAGVEVERRKVLQAQIDAARREKSRAEIESVDLNDKDKTDALSAVGTTMKQLFTGDWGRMAEAKTAEGDAVRKEAQRKAEEADRRIRQLEEEKRRSEERQSRLENEAADIRRQAEIKGGETVAARLERDAADSRSSRENEAAGKSLSDRQAQIARDRALIGGADATRAGIQARIDAANAEEQAAADRANREDRDAYEARQRLSQADASSRGKGWKRYAQGERRGLADDVRREEDEAAEAKASFSRTKSAVAETLRKLNEEMRQFEADLRSAKSRMKVNSDNGESE